MFDSKLVKELRQKVSELEGSVAEARNRELNEVKAQREAERAARLPGKNRYDVLFAYSAVITKADRYEYDGEIARFYVGKEEVASYKDVYRVSLCV